jgi:hypothetical protein
LSITVANPPLTTLKSRSSRRINEHVELLADIDGLIAGFDGVDRLSTRT